MLSVAVSAVLRRRGNVGQVDLARTREVIAMLLTSGPYVAG